MQEERPNTRLELGEYYADIIPDPRSKMPLFHWIVQRTGNDEVLEWGNDRTHDGACNAAQRTLEWHERQTKKLAS